MNNQDEAIALTLRLMKANRTTDMANHMLDNWRQLMPDIPDSFWDEIDPSDLEDLLIPIYTRHLTIEDMRAVIEFYESPAGQKILDKTPAIMEESMKAGEQWGIELGKNGRKSMTWYELQDLMRKHLTAKQMKDDVTIYDANIDEFFRVTDCHWTPSDESEGLGAGILDENHFFLEI